VLIVRTIQLRLRRPIPMQVPINVARMIPAADTRIVFQKPSISASRTGAFWERSLPVIWNEAGLSRKSKLVGMFWRSALAV
jgi:hypothetical protein